MEESHLILPAPAVMSVLQSQKDRPNYPNNSSEHWRGSTGIQLTMRLSLSLLILSAFLRPFSGPIVIPVACILVMILLCNIFWQGLATSVLCESFQLHFLRDVCGSFRDEPRLDAVENSIIEVWRQKIIPSDNTGIVYAPQLYYIRFNLCPA